MALIVLFILGVGNFAMHRAIVDSGHPMLMRAPWFANQMGGYVSLLIEYLMLLACMVMTAQGSAGWVWGYGLYTMANGVAAWLVLSRRI
jgi:hypothetical protein